MTTLATTTTATDSCAYMYMLLVSPRHRFHIINEKLFWCSYGNESLRAHVAAIAEKCNPDYREIY